MSLGPGSRLGPYEIQAAIGAGGMGEVYQARDTKLGRHVAIKVVADLFLQDVERLARFEREAKTLASLNHPNIAAIHGVEESNGVQALVLELVEGPTLAERIARGPLPVDEASRIARQITDALEAAHDHGIIHRDLKPANIKLRSDGTVKVLDFGLAKAIEGELAEGDVSHSPTLSMAATRAGVILGTAAYMAPEQAKGAAVDRRADLFAFGAVLYEMLTGRRAFPGDSTTEIVAAVLKSEPDWSLLPADTPEPIRRLLRRCFEKDRRRRLQTAGDARIEIEDALAAEALPVVGPVGPRRRSNTAWVAAVPSIIAALLAVPALLHFREQPPPEALEMRSEIVTPATSDPTSFALSPDGRQLVFVASGDGLSRLWLRSLSATTSDPLPRTEGASSPFWSPDSGSVGFVADGMLKRLDIEGGPPQDLASVPDRRGGGAWNSDGVILFAPNVPGPLFRIPASGGQAVAVTRLDRQLAHRRPQFLPDNRRFIFSAAGTTPESDGIFLGSLNSGDVKRLADSARALYVSPGWLLFMRGTALIAQRFDLDREELVGEPVTIANPVEAGFSANGFSVSTRGLIAYRSATTARPQLAWFDRRGQLLGTIATSDREVESTQPDLSPDGRRVAVARRTAGNSASSGTGPDIWLLDGTRASRFTFSAGPKQGAIWSSDGNRIVFRSIQQGRINFLVKPSSGAGAEELLQTFPAETESITNDWSPDGRFVLYHSREPQTDRDLWVLPLEGDRKPRVFLQTKSAEAAGVFSPDGRWVAYQSNESGRYEIYVRPFSAPDAAGSNVSAGAQWQISTSGGLFARWRADGAELYYVAPDGRLMAVPLVASRDTLEPGTPVPLFQTRILGGGTDTAPGRQYAVSRDGRFLVNTLPETAAPIVLLQNWKPPAN